MIKVKTKDETLYINKERVDVAKFFGLTCNLFFGQKNIRFDFLSKEDKDKFVSEIG